jgi:hypothetical protein
MSDQSKPVAAEHYPIGVKDGCCVNSNQDVIRKFCELQSKVWNAVIEPSHPSDCFCGELQKLPAAPVRTHKDGYRNDLAAFDFIETATLAAINIVKGEPAAESSDALPAVCERKELPDGPGLWFRNGEAWVILAIFEAEWRIICGRMILDYGGLKEVRAGSLPRGHWLKADALPAPAGELERLRAELAEVDRFLDRRDALQAGDRMGNLVALVAAAKTNDPRGEVAKLTTTIASLEKRLADAEEDLEVTRQLEGSFWEALKPLNLPAINVQNPGAHVTDLIQRATAAEAFGCQMPPLPAPSAAPRQSSRAREHENSG